MSKLLEMLANNGADRIQPFMTAVSALLNGIRAGETIQRLRALAERCTYELSDADRGMSLIGKHGPNWEATYTETVNIRKALDDAKYNDSSNSPAELSHRVNELINMIWRSMR